MQEENTAGSVCFLQALLPGAAFAPSGAQGGLAVSFPLGQEALPDPPKGGGSTSPFCAEKVCFPRRDLCAHEGDCWR